MQGNNQMNGLKIIEAFQTITKSSPYPEQISSANEYLTKCQKQASFSLNLLEIFRNHASQQIQLQSILLFTNVIKRNWSKKRNSYQPTDLEELKPTLRKYLINLYVQKIPLHIVQFNQIFKFLSRQEFPRGYPELHTFVVETLKGINGNDEHILNRITANTVHLLGTIKGVLKQFSIKKIMHQKEDFIDYIIEIIKIAINIEEKLANVLRDLSGMNIANCTVFININRKIQKIILYCLSCMPSNLQSSNDFISLITRLLQKVDTYNQMLKNYELRPQLQASMHSILKNTIKIQTYYPFLFSQFLSPYLQMLLKMVMNPQDYTLDKLQATCISALTKPFQTFAYYMTDTEFSHSLLCRKQDVDYTNQQKICHQQFINTFNPQNIAIIFQKVLTDLLTYHAKTSFRSDLIFDDFDPTVVDTLSDPTPSELLIVLLRNIMKCFKLESKLMIEEALRKSISNNTINDKLFAHLLEMVILMPKIYDTHQLPLDLIMTLLTVLFDNSSYYLFARLVRNFHNHFDSGSVNKIFDTLCLLVSKSTNIDADSLYQCAVCIKKMMGEHEELPLNHVDGCLRKIIGLYKVYANNPVLLWPLINLTVQLLKSLPEEALGSMIEPLVNDLEPIINIQNGEQLIICGVAELIQTIVYLSKTNSPFILHKCLVLVIRNIRNKNIESVTNIHRLWLRIIQQYYFQPNNQTTEQINNSFLTLFHQCSSIVFEEDPELYVQIIEEYMLSGLIRLSEDQLQSVMKKCLSESEQNGNTNCRIIMSIFSLYFSYSISNNSFLPNWVGLLMKYLVQFAYSITPNNNIVRTLLLIIFHHHIRNFGVENIYNCLANLWNQYQSWFLPYCWSMEYVSNKYGYKINSIGVLSSLLFLNTHNMLNTLISNQYPMDILIKVSLLGIEPLKSSSCILSYQNLFRLSLRGELGVREGITRKIRHQFIKDACELDLTGEFKQMMNRLFNGWQEEHFLARFDKSIAEKILNILHAKQYTIQQEDLR